MKKKKICYISTHGFSLRMISQTNLLGKLTKFFDVSLILIKDPGTDFKNYLSENKIKLHFLNDSKNYNEYNFAKKYFVKEFLSNIALLEKHKKAAFFNNSLNPWKRIRPFFYIFIHRIALIFPIIFNLYNYLITFFLNDSNYINLLNKIKPDLLVSTYPVDILEAKLIHNAKQKSILTLTHLLSWDNITAKGKFESLSDKFFVWGGVMQDELIDLYNINKKDIINCGVPHFDIHNKTKSKEAIKKFVSKLHLDPNIPYLIFGMSSPYFAPLEIEIVEKISLFIENSNDLDLQMIVRPHPQNVKGYLSDQSWLPRLKEIDRLKRTSVYYPSLAKGDIPWQMNLNDLDELSTAIQGAYAVLNTCSTFAIDGMLNNKPVIMTPFDSNEILNYWLSSRKQLDITHINKFIKITKPYVAKSYDSLFSLISSNLKVTYKDSDIKYYNYGYKSNSTDITIKNLNELLSA